MVGVPVVAQWKRVQLGTMRLPVPSMAWISELRIWCCHELWCSLQKRLRSAIAVAMAQAGCCSSDSTPSLGTSICHRCSPQKIKKKKKKEGRKDGRKEGRKKEKKKEIREFHVCGKQEHTPKKPMGQRRSHKGNQKIL